MTLFGRKTGCPRLEKTILFCVFSVFWDFPPCKAIDYQWLAEPEAFQKKSCLKTSRRFFVFWDV